jgi:hypothetical protein
VVATQIFGSAVSRVTLPFLSIGNFAGRYKRVRRSNVENAIQCRGYGLVICA